MQILLGKGDLDFRFPESPVNLLVKLTLHLQPIISIHYPDAKLKIEGTLPETQKQHLGGGKAANISWSLAQATSVSITRGTSEP